MGKGDYGAAAVRWLRLKLIRRKSMVLCKPRDIITQNSFEQKWVMGMRGRSGIYPKAL